MNNSSPYVDLYNWSVTDPHPFGKAKRKQSIGRLPPIRSAILPTRHSFMVCRRQNKFVL